MGLALTLFHQLATLPTKILTTSKAFGTSQQQTRSMDVGLRRMRTSKDAYPYAVCLQQRKTSKARTGETQKRWTTTSTRRQSKLETRVPTTGTLWESPFSLIMVIGPTDHYIGSSTDWTRFMCGRTSPSKARIPCNCM